MRRTSLSAGFVVLCLLASPALGQFTVLDRAQDQGPDQVQGQVQDQPQGAGEAQMPPEPVVEEAAETAPSRCGTQPLTIARMNWSSAALLAEIHARVLTQEFGCAASVVAGDLAATASSMASTGQPAIAPEMWVTRIADVWNAASESQTVRSAAPSFTQTTMEGWFVPAYLDAALAEARGAADLAAALAAAGQQEPVRLISCPIDWACSVINRNLVAAHGLEALVEVVEPANRFEMDALIAEAVSRRETFIFYYWQPNAVLAQVDFRALDMGAYDEEAMQCLARRDCDAPKASAFPSEIVVAALAEWVFTEAPAIAGYFQRASVPLAEMNTLLAQLNEPEASVESVAQRFVEQRRDLWGGWTGAGP